MKVFIFSTLFAFNSDIISSFIWLVKNFFHLFYLFKKFLYLSDNSILLLRFAHIIVCLSQTQLDYNIIIHQYLSTLFLFFYFVIFICPQTESWISFLPYLTRLFHDNTEIKKVSPSSKKTVKLFLFYFYLFISSAIASNAAANPSTTT